MQLSDSSLFYLPAMKKHANCIDRRPHSTHAGAPMTKSVIVVLITLSLFTGCTTGPAETDSPQPSIVIDVTSVNTSVLLALQAYSDGNKLFIQFQNLSETVNSYAVLPALQETPMPGSSTSLTLQQAVEQYNDLPLAQISYLEPQQ